MKLSMTSVVAVFAFGVISQAAFATEMEDLQKYCKPDIERLCPGVPFGGGKVKACLMAHQKEMSVGCAQALQAMKNG